MNFHNSMTAYRVILTPDELRAGAEFGIALVINGLGRTPRFPYRPGELWRANIMGALAEVAVAKMTGWLWTRDVKAFRSKKDVGGVEVRWCGDDRDPYLKIRNDEKPEERCVCVTGDVTSGGFLVQGWLLAGDAAMIHGAQWIEAGESSYWRVPVALLRPMSELIEMVKREGGQGGLGRTGSRGSGRGDGVQGDRRREDGMAERVHPRAGTAAPEEGREQRPGGRVVRRGAASNPRRRTDQAPREADPARQDGRRGKTGDDAPEGVAWDDEFPG